MHVMTLLDITSCKSRNIKYSPSIPIIIKYKPSSHQHTPGWRLINEAVHVKIGDGDGDVKQSAVSYRHLHCREHKDDEDDDAP